MLILFLAVIRESRSRQEQLQLRRIEIENQMPNRRVELADLENVSRYVDDLHNLLKEGSLAERRAFIKSFIKEIRVTGNEAALAYTIPILPEKVTIEKEGVLPIVQYGGPSDPIAQPRIKTFFELLLVPADYYTININPQK